MREISSGDIRNAKINVENVARFLDPATGEPSEIIKLQWINSILAAAPGEDPAGLGQEGKDAQVAMFLSLMYELNKTSL